MLKRKMSDKTPESPQMRSVVISLEFADHHATHIQNIDRPVRQSTFSVSDLELAEVNILNMPGFEELSCSERPTNSVPCRFPSGCGTTK